MLTLFTTHIVYTDNIWHKKRNIAILGLKKNQEMALLNNPPLCWKRLKIERLWAWGCFATSHVHTLCFFSFFPSSSCRVVLLSIALGWLRMLPLRHLNPTGCFWMLRLLWFHALSTQHQVVIWEDVPFQECRQAKKKKGFEESASSTILRAWMLYSMYDRNVHNY